MLETLKFFISDVEGFDKSNHLEPLSESQEGDVIVGLMPDYIRSMYAIVRKVEKDRDALSVEMKYMNIAQRNNTNSHFAEVNHTFYTYYQLLMFEIRSHFDLWDKQKIMLLTGYRVAYSNTPDSNDIFSQLGIRLIG